MRDYLADLIIRIKNAQRAGLPDVQMHPYLPKRYVKILRLLYREGYIRGFVEHCDGEKQKIRIKVLLKYSVRGEPIIEDIFQISKPGRRIYTSIKAL
jgi:small subunit ribosomal protein S8